MPGASLNRAIWWAKIRQLAGRRGGRFSAGAIDQRRALLPYLDFLKRHGYLCQVEGRREWELVRNPGPSAPIEFRGGCYDPNCAGEIHDPLLRIWSALRRLTWLTLPELAANSEATHQVTRRYCRRLEQAGYLAVCFARHGRKGVRLLRDTGPAAPIPERGTGRVFDPNLGVFVEVDDATA